MNKKLNYTIHRFQTKDNITLTGLLNKSNSKINQETIIIHIHGMCSDLLSNSGQLIAEAANKSKISAFLINTRGHGIVSSFKKINKNKTKSYITAGTAFENFEDSEFDINSAIKYLKTLGYKKIILSGHSTGCQKITNYQINNLKNKTIKSLILLSPGDDLNIEKKEKKEKFSETLKFAKIKINSKILFHTEDFGILSAKRFYNLFKKTSIEGNLFNYKKNLNHLNQITIPTLSIIGKQDPYFLDQKKASINIAQNLTNKLSQSKLIEGNHTFYQNEIQVKKEITQFLKSIQK